MKRLLIVAVAALGLGGCASHTWAPGPQAAGDFGIVSGQCKLLAMSGGSGGGFVGAYGSPKFVGAVVGGSILAGAIGSAVQQNEIFNACMEAQGFHAVDELSASERAQIHFQGVQDQTGVPTSCGSEHPCQAN